MPRRALFRNGRRVFRNGKAVFVNEGEQSACLCCRTLCKFCEDGNGPDQIQVVISGVTNQFCPSCNLLNGTFILDRIVNPTCETGSTCCRWEYEFSTAPCSVVSNPRLVLSMHGTGGLSSTAFLRLTGQGMTASGGQWQSGPLGPGNGLLPADGSIDCDFSALALPTTFNTGCNIGASTCTVTAL